jgi:serine protease Do
MIQNFSFFPFKVAVCLLVSALSMGSVICHASPPTFNQKHEVQDFTRVAKNAIPAVVSIRVKGSAKFSSRDSDEDSQDPSDFFNEDFFQRFFGSSRNRVESQPVVGQASGFIVAPDGYILTNAHVVKDMSEITVVLNDDREFKAKVVGADPNSDVALLKIDGKDLPYLKLGNSDDLEVGQPVAAIGNPLGLQASLTVGVVSAKGRNNLDLSGFQDYIQTDAAINRGNSGGPLLDMNSQVVGMNTAIITNMATGGYMGIGFAIPSNLLQVVMNDLKDTGSFKRGFIGIVLQPVDENLAQVFNLNKAQGALIAEVTANSPAEKAGLKQGDVILKYNDVNVANIGSLRMAIGLMKPGTKITLSVLREGRPQEIQVEVGAFPGNEPIASASSDNKLGIEIENLTPEQAAKLGYSNEKGIVIKKVDPSSAAAWAGLKKGALIVEVNQKKISNVKEFNEALKATPADKPILFLIKQGDVTRFISFKIG